MNKYTIIEQYIKDLVGREKLKTGQKLPSVRELAGKLQCSTLTVVRALKELEQEHIIYSVPKSGYYLVSKEGNQQKDPGNIIDFSTVLPDIDLIPYKEFQHCQDQAMKVYKKDLSSYGNAQGLPSLIQTLTKQLQDYQVFCKPSAVVITAGSQQALDILAKLDFPNGKNTVLIENPTYEPIIKNLEMNKIRTIGIEKTFNGIDLNRLEQLFKEEPIKFFYTIPRFHNPLGNSYSNSEKKSILKLAQKYEVYIVEDDYLVDLDTNKKNVPIFSLDDTDRVIFLKTFSKILLPGLRIAAVVLPAELVSSFLQFKQWSDIYTSILPQGALDIYIKNGIFERSKLLLQRTYKERMKYLKHICSEFDPEILRVNVPPTGFFLSMESQKSIDFSHIIPTLAKSGVIIKDTRENFIEKDREINLLKISVSRTDKKKIRDGLLQIYDYFTNKR
ncbi:PLP-dependent aminotransferase family protein [Desulforamulus ruminis]|uniref:Regulatory protein GntR HTH n=1 Tax=Desulforamulus ruminis (strain ATCC 23193 / DSM 2154 / NCIMB 8452 / DL) TaxID=696281 RepID=F6DQV8_DESRL|nr:PLP-dependent aminotransferase family protein [Desulforamulus ruminis]AEG58682.1 regulatory protein GntR HTH [Desulforamulus ruminis DSM 2154]